MKGRKKERKKIKKRKKERKKKVNSEAGDMTLVTWTGILST